MTLFYQPGSMTGLESTLEILRRNSGSVVIGTFTAVVFCAVALLIFIFTGTLSGAEATAVATVLLVLLTGGYATVTYLMVRETRKAREQEIQPVLDFQAREVESTIINSGNGPARNLEVTLSLQPAGDHHPVQRQSLPANGAVAILEEPFSSIADRGYQDLQLQATDVGWEDVDENDPDVWEELDEPYQRLTMEGMCEDVWGNTHTIREEYKVYDLTEGVTGTVEPSTNQEISLELIAVELSRLREAIYEFSKENQ